MATGAGPSVPADAKGATLTIWSSSSIWMSSRARRIDVPVSRHAIVSNAIPVQSPCILSSVRSRLYSLLAYSLTSTMSSKRSCESAWQDRLVPAVATAKLGRPGRAEAGQSCLRGPKHATNLELELQGAVDTEAGVRLDREADAVPYFLPVAIAEPGIAEGSDQRDVDLCVRAMVNIGGRHNAQSRR